MYVYVYVYAHAGQQLIGKKTRLEWVIMKIIHLSTVHLSTVNLSNCIEFCDADRIEFIILTVAVNQDYLAAVTNYRYASIYGSIQRVVVAVVVELH